MRSPDAGRLGLAPLARLPAVAALPLLLLLPSAAAGQAPVGAALVEELRFAEDEAAGVYLGYVRYLSVGPDGSIYAADPQIPAVLVFDARGRFVRQLGRPGDGPGEFRSITGMGWAEGVVWAADRSRMRAVIFSPAGDLLDTRSAGIIEVQGGERPSQLAGVLADGSLLMLGPPRAGAGGSILQPAPLVRLRPTGATPASDTLLHVRQTVATASVVVGGARREVALPVPRNDDRWALAPGSDAVARATAVEANGVIVGYRIHVFELDGSVRFETAVEHEPIRVTAEERDRFVATLADRLQSMDSGMPRSAAVRTARGLIPAVDTRMAIDLLEMGTDGRVWIHRRDQPGQLSVLDARTGRVEARVGLPGGRYPGMGIHAMDGDHVWMVETDAFGVRSIVRYAVR